GDSRPRAQPLAAWHPQGRLAAGCLQGAATSGQPYRQQGGGADHRGGRPVAGRLPAGKGSRCLRRGNDGTVMVREEG
ncbi:hypothetical protein GW17_00061859, partial [Ensete ventricosum]